MTLELTKVWLQAKLATERGAGLVEYVLLAALIAVVCIIGVTFLGDSTSGKYSEIGSHVIG